MRLGWYKPPGDLWVKTVENGVMNIEFDASWVFEYWDSYYYCWSCLSEVGQNFYLKTFQPC